MNLKAIWIQSEILKVQSEIWKVSLTQSETELEPTFWMRSWRNWSGQLNSQSEKIWNWTRVVVSYAFTADSIRVVVVVVVTVHAKTSPVSITSAYSIKTNTVTHQILNSMMPRSKSKKKPLPWNVDHMDRQFIFYEITACHVTPYMGSRAIHNKYKDTVRSFKFSRMEYSSTFASLLTGIRKIVSKDRSQASVERQTLTNAIWNYPPTTHNSRGEPQWNGYEAQIMLDDDIEAGNHLRTNTK